MRADECMQTFHRSSLVDRSAPRGRPTRAYLPDINKDLLEAFGRMYPGFFPVKYLFQLS